MSWRSNFLARQATQPPSEHGPHWNKLVLWLLSCYKTWHGTNLKTCIGSNAFPKSQVYWAQGTKHAQQQITACSLVKNSSQGWACVAKTACAIYVCCCVSHCCFLGVSGEGLQARRFILVCQPAPSCSFNLLGLSVGRRNSRPSGKEELLGVSCRSGRLSWQAGYQLCCSDLCYR